MNLDPTPRLERDLPAMFDELAAPRTPDYLEAAIERASSRSQRPAWTFPERWLPMDIVTRPVDPRSPMRAIGILALIGVLIAAGLAAAYIGSRSHVPANPFGLAANGQIAFTGNGDIRTVDQVTGKVSDLIVGPEVVGKPSYSLDGRHIAFVRDAGGPNDHVVVAASDGESSHRRDAGRRRPRDGGAVRAVGRAGRDRGLSGWRAFACDRGRRWKRLPLAPHR